MINFGGLTLQTSLLAFVALSNASPFGEVNARQATSIPSPWVAIGCYSDVPSARTLRVASFTDVNNMTIEACLAFCTPAGYKFSGVEFARECYCDNVIESPGVPTSSSTCNMPCAGNANEICGGAGGINIFQNTAVSTPTSTPPPPTTTSSTASSTVISTTSAPTSTPSPVQTVGTFQYQGCFNDGINGASRSLIHQLSVPGGVTAESCTAACKAAGFILAGLEFGQECWCDIYMPLATPAPESTCNMPCNANPKEICGAGNRLSLYVDTSAPALNLSTCLNGAQLQAGNVPEFNFDLEARFIPAFPGASVNTPVPLGNTAVPQASSPNGLHLVVLGVNVDQGRMFTMGTDTIGQLEVLISKNAQGISNGSAVVPVPGGPQFFDIGQFDNFPEMFMYCPQVKENLPLVHVASSH
ncbi:WSC-domain-containing protein [Agrocybe pediades]|nr:WSC-domain-containing protein [Agrocybe pediades]